MRARLLARVSVRGVVAFFALAFFFAPLALRAAGVTARAFENRPMATFPALSQGWDGLEQAAQFFVDRLPLREQAVRADAWVSSEVFDTNPAAGRAGEQGPAGLPADERAIPEQPAAAPPAGDKAVAGKAGWLFLEGEFVRACAAFIPWRSAMSRWQRMASIIRRSGRRVVLVFPPDKSTIHPEYLPDSFAQRDCLAAGHRAAWRAIEGARDPAVLGLRQAMLAAKRPGTDGPYYRQDTHWNRMGATIAVREVLEHLGEPVRMRPPEILRSRNRYQGDLTVLNGDPQFDEAPVWRIHRAPAAPRLDGRTLFLHDSFGDTMIRPLSAYLYTPVMLPWFGTGDAALVDAITAADTVVLETVEREMNFRASDQGQLKPAFLARLARELPRRRP